MTFGGLEDDYPEFKPFEKVAEAAETEEEADTQEETDDEEPAEPPFKTRSQEKIDTLEKLEPATTTLTNEKRYFAKLQPYLYSPFINILNDKDDTYLGFGACFRGMYPKWQIRTGLICIDN